MDLGLTGKVAMVAGASKGLGFATAQALVREGARVSILARRPDELNDAVRRLQSEGTGEVVGVTGDLADSDAVPSWHERTKAALGDVEILFANTGGPPPGAFENVDDAGWQAGVDLLLFPMIRMARAVLPDMVKAQRGSILFSTSSAVKVAITNLTVSTVVRAAVSALSRTLAEQYAAAGIRINQIVPGRIDTDRVQSLDQANAKRAGIEVEEQRAKSVGTIPLGRYGQPREFGDVAAFLLSDRAGYVTGATVQVDGGLIRTIL